MPTITFPEAVIGRRAFNRRNNLFYDYDERIIYIASTQIVQLPAKDHSLQKAGKEEVEEEELDEDEDSHILLNQEFLQVDSRNLFTISPEISCLALSDDRKILGVGTTQTAAKIIIWEICSRTMITSMTLNVVITILNLKFAHDSRHICCIGLTKEHTLMVFLIDSLQSQILGAVNLQYSISFKIKDMCFLPDSIYSFVTCGLQHMSLWVYNGSTLQFSAMAIQNTKEMMEL